MYFYIFDSFLQEKKHGTTIAQIETRLASLGIQGRTEKITILKSLTETTREAIKRGATTIVAVGNDKTVTKLLPIVIEHDLTLGIIPVGEPQLIADYLGIPPGARACENISRRIIERLDIGLANNQHFLLEATIPAQSRVMCDGKYAVESLDPHDTMLISNFGQSAPGNPRDGKLELVVQGQASGGWFNKRSSRGSVFPLKKAKIERDPLLDPTGGASLVLDGQLLLKTPATIEVLPKKLSVIVGRDRAF